MSSKSILSFEKGWSFPIAIVVAIVFSSFTIIVIQSWIKYPLFLFQIAVILTVLFVMNHGRYQANRWNTKIFFSDHGSEKILNLLLIGSSIGLLVLDLFDIDSDHLRLALALVSGSFLSGYAILNISGVKRYFSALEGYVISFIVSFVFLAFLTLVLLGLEEAIRSIIVSSVFLFIGISSFLKNRSRNTNSYNDQESLSRRIDIIPILVTVTFYITFFFILYPGATLLPGTDISRHFNDSLVLTRSPQHYGEFYYLIFHLFQSGHYTLAGTDQSVTYVLSSLIILNVFLPLSVYVFAKRFLSSVDKRIPSISLILYSFSSNLSFLYYTQLTFISQAGVKPEYGVVAREVAEKSYFGITNFLQPFTFFVPLSVSIIMFCVIFAILRNLQIPRRPFVILLSILLIVMYFVHVVEAVVFVLMISIFSFFSTTPSMRLSDSLLSCIIGFSIIGLLLVLQPLVLHSEVRIEQGVGALSPLIVLVPIFVAALSLYWRSKRALTFNLLGRISRLIVRKDIRGILSYGLIAAYLSGIILWVFIDDFRSSQFSDIGVVPWFIYPIILGIVGLLAILTIKASSQDISTPDMIKFLVFAIAFSFFLGKLISYINVNIVETSYWEKRFLLLIFLFCSLLAPVSLLKLRDFFVDLKSKVTGNIIVSALVSSIVICGFSSMAIQLEYWYLATTGANRISEFEFKAVEFLKNILGKDESAFTVAPTAFSNHILSYAASPYQLSKPDLLFNSMHPQVPLMTMTVPNLDHAYVYLHTRDFQQLSKNPESWFTRHLLPILPEIFSNKDVRIYNASAAMLPQHASDTILLLPQQARTDSWMFGYDALYQSKLNYSESYDPNPNLSSIKNLVLPIDPIPRVEFHEGFSTVTEGNRSLDLWRPLSGNWSLTPSGLQGKGSPSDLFENRGIILSPAFSIDGTISTLFKIQNVNPEVFSYASVITSWQDKNNNRFAGIAVRDDKVYSYLGKVDEGRLSFEPRFPFHNTGLDGRAGANINLTVSVNDERQELFINGTRYLSGTIDGHQKGLPTGLSFSRLSSVLFYDYEVEEPQTEWDPPIDRFIEFVEDGGKLVVINAEGPGEIAQLLSGSTLPFNFSHLTTLSPDGKQFVNVVPDRAKHNIQENGLNALTQRKQQNFFALEASLGRGNILYINIYPLLQNYNASKPADPLLYPLLGKLAQLFGTKEIASNSDLNIREISAFFDRMTSSGDVELKSDSIIMRPSDNDNLFDIDVHKRGSEKLSLKGSIVSLGHDFGRVSLHSGDLNLGDGKGLYSQFLIRDDPVTLRFDKSTTLGLRTANASQLEVNNVSALRLSGFDTLSGYVKQPLLNIDGVSDFEKFEAEKFLYSKLGVKEMPAASFVGKFNASLVLSDETSLLTNISTDGSLALEKPSYNEFSIPFTSRYVFNLYDIPPLVRGLLLIPFAVTVLFLFHRKIF